jgi:hypothetical protein
VAVVDKRSIGKNACAQQTWYPEKTVTTAVADLFLTWLNLQMASQRTGTGRAHQQDASSDNIAFKRNNTTIDLSQEK